MRFLRIISIFIPASTAFVVIMLSAVPWGIPPKAAFVFPMITLSILSYWALVKPNYLPAWLVFILGITTDLLTDSPLGYWSLLFLLAFALTVEWRRIFGVRGILFNSIGFAVLLILISALAWSLASLYFLRMIDISPLIFSTGITLLSFPFLCLFLKLFQPLLETQAIRPRRFGGYLKS